jgi:hypothetical protein
MGLNTCFSYLISQGGWKKEETKVNYLEEMDTIQLWKFLTVMRQRELGNSELANEIQNIMIKRLWVAN